MSKWDKLIAQLYNTSKEFRFDELRKILEKYGYEMKGAGSGSSHFTFRKQGCNPVTIPKSNPVKKAYIELVRQVVESEEKNNENT